MFYNFIMQIKEICFFHFQLISTDSLKKIIIMNYQIKDFLTLSFLMQLQFLQS